MVDITDITIVNGGYNRYNLHSSTLEKWETIRGITLTVAGSTASWSSLSDHLFSAATEKSDQLTRVDIYIYAWSIYQYIYICIYIYMYI